MNNTGRVIGTHLGTGVEAWVWSSGTGLTLLPMLPGSTSSQAFDINDHGDIVGQSGTTPVAWRLGADGYTVEILAPPPSGTAYAINEQGDIVGTHFFWPVWFNSPTGILHLDTYGFTGIPYDINEEQQVIGGWSPHRLDLDTMELSDMGTPPPGPMGSYNGAYLYAINNAGTAVGFGALATSTPDNQTCIRYEDGTGWLNLDNLPGPYNSAAGISDSGLIVTAIPPGVYVEGTGLLTINSLLQDGDQEWTFNGWYGIDINDHDEIALIGTNGTTGQSGAVLLKPILPAATGDLNDDEQVDAADLAMLLGTWGPCAPQADCPADLSSDGMVDAADLAILLGNWT